MAFESSSIGPKGLTLSFMSHSTIATILSGSHGIYGVPTRSPGCVIGIAF